MIAQMDTDSKSAQSLAAEHRQIAEDIQRLGTIATELDEVASAYTVETWAERAEADPSLGLLSQLVELLASFKRGLEGHFSREEKHFPELAQRHDAAALVASLVAEHKEALKQMAALRGRAAELSESQAALQTKRAEVDEFIKSLKALLGTLADHAEKEDQVLFITDHNV